MRGRELLAGIGRAGLEQDRASLRRTPDVQRPLDREILALVIERMELGRIEEHAARTVAHERVFLP